MNESSEFQEIIEGMIERIREYEIYNQELIREGEQIQICRDYMDGE